METTLAPVNAQTETTEEQVFTKIINLCPHAVNLISDTGACLTFEASGTVARVDTSRKRVTQKLQPMPGLTMDLQVQQHTNSKVINLPDPEEGTLYLVSAFVAQFFGSSRTDLISPNTDSTAYRDGQGRVTGVKDFTRYL